MDKPTLLVATVSLLLFATGAFAADKADFDTALSAAKSAVATAANAGGEWRDTGKIIKEAEQAAAAGDYDKAVLLANEAKQQGILGTQQANRGANAGNPDYLYK